MKITLDEPQIEKQAVTEESIEREAINKTLAGEKKKLSQMNFDEKCSYIWSYYKIPIIATCVALVVLAYIVVIIITNKTTVLMGAIMNDSQTNKAVVCRDMDKKLGLPRKEIIDIQENIILGYGHSTGVNTGNMSGSTQMLCFMMAKELDFAIGDEDGLDFMKSNDVCVDLKTLLPSEIYEHFKEHLVQDDNGVDFAIDITFSKIYDTFGLHIPKAYIMFTDMSGHHDNLISFIEYLYELDK